MKILVFSSLAEDTGSFIRAKNIAQSLESSNLEVKLVKPFSKCLPFKSDMLISIPWYMFQALIYPCDFIFCIKSYPNVVIPILIKKILGTKVIIDTDDLSFAYTKGFWSKISKFSQELILRLADLHTFHNPKLIDYLVIQNNIPERKLYRLKQGVGSAFIKHQISKRKNNQLRKRLDLEGMKLLAFTGHFDVACDLDSILRAIPLVLKKIPNARLLLIGDGEKKHDYEKLARKLGISEAIIWAGLIDQNKMINYLDIADVTLVYYKNRKANFYRSSVKLREYLALGKRVITNDVGELKGFKKYTYQTSTRISDYSLIMIKLLKGYDDKRQIEGRIFVKKYYSWDNLIQDFIKRLEDLQKQNEKSQN